MIACSGVYIKRSSRLGDDSAGLTKMQGEWAIEKIFRKSHVGLQQLLPEKLNGPFRTSGASDGGYVAGQTDKRLCRV